ncbi:hypothetical protein K7887_07795 [Sutcliffiella horikoshii]|uniref:hypothetical protein n=1 Tax=Sutcliffiella horikoshii TaxID=79883 RepID=UPI001CBBCCBD|nr:hypothetical protein [Sutcliffiella horikoshii]UAL48821.1 hypothetical protein K7887_07795 [Sutcliffiella horikoshii]
METNAFKGLMRKEWLITKNHFIFLTCFKLFIWAAVLGGSLFTKNHELLYIATSMIIGIHVIYITMIVGSGLSLEEKSQMWLHNPRSTTMMLGSKLLTGILLQIISLFMAFLLLGLTVFFLDSPGENFLTAGSIFQMSIQLTFSGLELAIFYTFYWTVYHSMGKFVFLAKFKVVLFTLFIIASVLLILFIEKQLLAGLHSILPFPVEMTKFMNVYIEEEGLGIRSGSENISLAGLLISSIKIIGLFFLSSWLLNKAVEVK